MATDARPREESETVLGRSGRMTSCAECQRLRLKCDKKVPCASCVRRGCDTICPAGTMRSNGRGKRSTMSHVPELNTVITEMGERIRQLELALANARGHVWDMKKPIDALLASVPLRTESTLLQAGKVLGSFSVNGDGDAVYFGPTAGAESLLSIASSAVGLSQRERFPFTSITELFPVSSDQTPWDAELAVLQLAAQLPLEEQAWRLCETYYRNGCWTGMPIMQSEIVELLTLIYHNIASEDRHESSAITQQMAVLFLVFALASLVDLDLPPYNSEADRYFDLACAALSITPLFENPTVVTVQALTLLACYYSHGGPRFTMDGAWSTISLASNLSQRLGLHRESFGSKLSPKLSNRCRALFWETYSIETSYGLAVGRPTGTFLSDISCPFPPDEADDEQPFVKIFPGYRRARWRGTKEVTALIMENFLTTKKPTYKAVLEMDQRIRKYILSCPFKDFPSLENEPPFAYIQRNLIPDQAKIMILYVHSGYFVEALREKPTNPMASSYSASFLAGYLSATGIIEANKRNFTTHPLLFTRWWGVWKSLFHASIIIGITACRYPKKNHHPHAILALITAIDMFEKGAESSPRARSCLAILHRLRDKGVTAHSQVMSDPNPILPRPVDPEIERDLDIFVGYTRVVGATNEAIGTILRHPEPDHPLAPAQGTSELSEGRQKHDSRVDHPPPPTSGTNEPQQDQQHFEPYISHFFDSPPPFENTTTAWESHTIPSADISGGGFFLPYPPVGAPDMGGTSDLQLTQSWADFLQDS
ncbi:fungal-specific transcription factor domain-containing protein [Mycena capillaripes]|nr:fungal-specific transcription factor domain-containing protein [Mycena capillaripes]